MPWPGRRLPGLYSPVEVGASPYSIPALAEKHPAAFGLGGGQQPLQSPLEPLLEGPRTLGGAREPVHAGPKRPAESKLCGPGLPAASCDALDKILKLSEGLDGGAG